MSFLASLSEMQNRISSALDFLKPITPSDVKPSNRLENNWNIQSIGSNITNEPANSQPSFKVEVKRTVYTMNGTKPTIFHDNGFLQNPDDPKDPIPIETREPTREERKFYLEQIAKVYGLDGADDILPGDDFSGRIMNLDDALEAYKHFLTGDGEDRYFDYDKFLDNDYSGKIVKYNANLDARVAAEQLYNKAVASGDVSSNEPYSFSFTSDVLKVGGNGRYPYPDTENWQKAIGGHPLWTETKVTFIPQADGSVIAEATTNLNVEDRYNFNRGSFDIQTGDPDDLRGVLEECGLAHQYTNYASTSFENNWTLGDSGASIIKKVEEGGR